MRMSSAFIIAALSLMLAWPAAAQTPPPPIVKTEGLRQVSPRVHIIPDNNVPLVPNVGFVIGDKAILAIDTGLGSRNGAAVAEVARKLGGDRQLYLVITHVHPEHDLGAHGFPGSTRLIRSNDQVKDIAEFGLQLAKAFAARSALVAELLAGADFRKADITFDKEYDLDLGGVQAKILAMGSNHTRGDTVVWVESDRVLFSGDVAMQAQPAFPVMASPYSTIRQWLASLERLEALKPAIIVPSHGPNGDPGFMTSYRAYLAEARDRTAAEKKAGRTLEQAIETVTAAMKRFPDKGRLAGAIRQAYAEAP